MPRLFARIVLAAILPSAVLAETPNPQPPPPVSSTGEQIYAAARPRLLQVRTLLAAQDKQTTLGSAFVVTPDGLAVTNYHVVSQYALEPDTYRLEWAGADDRHGGLALLAVDVADDLAIVRLDKPAEAQFSFDPRALDGTLPKGEQIYALGNPLDLGFSIVEGTYNGPVERNYQERLHFSGAVNPSMSGGPAVTADGRIVGINVSKQLQGELVSFLVPARFAATLVAKAQALAKPPDPASFRDEIGRQLTDFQAGLYRTVIGKGFAQAKFGPYRGPEAELPWMNCWGGTNAGQAPPPRAAAATTACSNNTMLFVANDLGTGSISLSHAYLKSIDLNDFQFAAFVRQMAMVRGGYYARKWHTHEDCREDFVQSDPAAEHPPLRLTWCAKAYREFPGLYDVTVVTATEDRGQEALVSRLSMDGVSWDNAIAMSRQFVDGITWNR